MIGVGIDPGKDGAVVALHLGDAGITIAGQWRTKDLCPKAYLPDEMREALEDVALHARKHGGAVCVALERVASRPGQGVASAFSFGAGWGLWRGLVAGYGWRVIEPTPQRWIRAVLSDQPGEGKERALARASQITGLELVTGRARVPHDGLADAACLALFALREGVI